MNTIATMNPKTVMKLIEEKGTKIATVEFLKADGSVRVSNGLFKPSSHIIGSERGVMQGEAMQKRGQVPFYDLKKKAWISFFADRVLEIN